MQTFKQKAQEDTGMRIIDLLPKKIKRKIYRFQHQDKYKAALLMMKALRKDPDVISRGLSKDRIQGIAADHFGLNHREFAKVLNRQTRYEDAPPGMADTVKKFKADGMDDDMAFALAWKIYNKKKNEAEYITEVNNLSRSVLARNPVRLDAFIKKVKKGDGFKLMNTDDTVVLHKDMIAGITVNSNPTTDMPNKPKDVDGNILTWASLEKTAEFGGQGASKEPTGAQWEALISVGVNRAVLGDSWKLGSDEWNNIEKFWDDYGPFAMKLGEEFKTRYKLKGLKQLGASTAPTSAEWKKTGANDRTPKTDMINNKVHISLKKSGGSQLMSGQAAETLSTFNAAMATYSGKNPRGLIKLMSKIETDMGKMTSKTSITALKKMRDSGKKLSQADEDKLTEFKGLDKIAKDLTTQMNKIFTSDDFKSHFCWEAATGETKFGIGADATATHVVTFHPKGYIEADLILDSIQGAGMTLAKKNSFYVAFKGGGRPALVTRAKNESFADIVKSECAEFLTEEMEQLDEFALFDRLKKQARNVSDAIKNQAGKIIDRIMIRVSQAFNAMKKMGEKMMAGLLEFFNFEVDKIKVSGGGDFPLV
jgi:hypothetical protein